KISTFVGRILSPTFSPSPLWSIRAKMFTPFSLNVDSRRAMVCCTECALGTVTIPRSIGPPIAANNLLGKLTTKNAPLDSIPPLNRPQKFDHPLFYRRSFMATSTRNAPRGSGSRALAENLERERTFDLFRQWGYLEADLDPLGLMPP